MSAGVAPRRRSLLAAVADFLVEPLEPEWAERVPVAAAPARTATAVVGLGPGYGATTVARALGAELALRDVTGAAFVTSPALLPSGVRLSTQSAGRLARALPEPLRPHARSSGRLCLLGHFEEAPLVDHARPLAPLVIDVDLAVGAATAAALADAVVIVATPEAEPALAELLAASLARVGPDPVVVLNRCLEPEDRWDGRCALRLPESRLGARLALSGREAPGELGAAIARLADLVGVGR